MASNTVFKQAVSDVALNRKNAEKLLNNRREELYEKHPDVYEIDRQISDKVLETLKITASGNSEINKAHIEDLKEQRNKLLKKYKIDLKKLFDVYSCKICNDTGYVENKKCACLVQRLVLKYYDMSNVKDAVKYENFDTFNIRYYSEKIEEGKTASPQMLAHMAYKHCLHFVQNFSKEFSNLLLSGNTGLGKTFSCNCIAKEILEQGKSVLYVTAPRLFKKIEDYRFRRDEMDEGDDQIDFIYESDLLIIDDLGSEFSTIVTNTAFFDILNTRLLSKKATVISTNLSMDEIRNTYTDRIFSRIIGNFTMLRLEGEDIRFLKKLGRLK